MIKILGEDMDGELIYEGDRVQVQTGQWAERIGKASESPDVGMILADMGGSIGIYSVARENVRVVLHEARVLTQGVPHG